MIAEAAADFAAQANPDADSEGLMGRYPKAVVSNFDGQASLTEMDALVAYLQVLGTMVDFSTFQPDPMR
jgi:cytochrome c oxidase cbb3-type subunit 2